ncbi:MAG: glycosyltransferase family 2 protein [Motiliproteus sp.]
MENSPISAACSSDDCELSIIMPCLNEAETLGICIAKAQSFIEFHHLCAEVIVADNGSTDGSQDIARAFGARVQQVSTRGYGAALQGGIKEAAGKYVIFADADDSYDFSALLPFLTKLREGFDLVMGNRFKGGIRQGAMPALHRYLGNPVLSGIGRLFFRSPVKDFHCGLRGFNRTKIKSLNLQTTGMEFASEMVVKATLHKLRITEVPTILSPDGRSHPPHLRSWRDGWRHLRFLMIYSPRWLFFYPGMLLLLTGLSLITWLLPGPQTIHNVTFDIHTMLYAAVMTIVGLQVTSFGLFAKVFSIGAKIIPASERIQSFLDKFTLERGLLAGLAIALCGFIGSSYAFTLWIGNDFGPLDPVTMMRLTIPSLTALATGIQVMFLSFFMSVLGLART